MAGETDIGAAFQVVRAVMREQRPSPATEKARAYTQETHGAIQTMLAICHANSTALLEAVGALSDRIKQLEAADSFKGVWQRALPYQKGAQVTHQGSLWTALRACGAGCQPGDNPTKWQLSAKGTAK